MAEKSDVRPGEVAIELPATFDAGVLFHRPHSHTVQDAGRLPKEYVPIQRDRPGRTRSALRARAQGPRNSTAMPILLYWMDQARRDLVEQVPAHLGQPRGTFALRSPVRPNPIALGRR